MAQTKNTEYFINVGTPPCSISSLPFSFFFGGPFRQHVDAYARLMQVSLPEPGCQVDICHRSLHGGKQGAVQRQRDGSAVNRLRQSRHLTALHSPPVADGLVFFQKVHNILLSVYYAVQQQQDARGLCTCQFTCSVCWGD